MPYRSNPHYADPTWGRAAENLVSGLFGNPMQEAQYEQQLTQTRLGQQEGKRNEEVWEAFRNTDVVNDREGYAQAVGRFGDTGRQQHAGALMLAGAGARGVDEVSDDQMRRFALGAGHMNAGGADFGTTAGRADEISDRNAAEAFAQQAMEERFAGQRNALDNRTRLQSTAMDNRGRLEREQLGLDNPRTLEGVASQRVLERGEDISPMVALFDPSFERSVVGSDLPLETQGRLLNNRGFTGDNFGPNRGGTFTGESGAGSGRGRGDPSIGDRINFGEAIDGAVGVAVPGYNSEDGSTDLPPQDRLDLESRATEIWRESGETLNAVEAVNQALAEFGGIEFADPGHDGWFKSIDPSNPRLVRPGGGGGQGGGGGGESQGGDPGQVVLTGPDGAAITNREIQETADNRGMSFEEVRQRLIDTGAIPNG